MGCSKNSSSLYQCRPTLRKSEISNKQPNLPPKELEKEEETKLKKLAGRSKYSANSNEIETLKKMRLRACSLKGKNW